jgi:hypothetical protein
MRKRILSAWAVALLLGQVSLVHAQENEESHFWASAQIRTRGEYRNGALSPRGEGDKPAGFINERARLTLGYERKKLSLKFSAQHVGRASSLINPAGLSPSPRGDSAPFRYSPLVRIWAEAQK